jgi:hypothetical protein
MLMAIMWRKMAMNITENSRMTRSRDRESGKRATNYSE